MLFIQMPSVHRFHALNCTNLQCTCTYYLQMQTNCEKTGVVKLSVLRTHFHPHRTWISCSAHSKKYSLAASILKDHSDILICCFNARRMRRWSCVFSAETGLDNICVFMAVM